MESDDSGDELLRDLAHAPPIRGDKMPVIAVSAQGVTVTERAPALTVGQVLDDRFEILEVIGRGGMGEVYRAKDRELGRTVAIKVIAIADEDRRKRFQIEARAASALHHPNVIAIYDVGQHDGTPYLVMEMLEGDTLRERLAAGPISPAKAASFALQIAAGLAAAHDAGIVHRDLKPENLVVTSDDRVKLVDFGLAKLTKSAEGVTPLSSATSAGVIVGTVAYMSPEQLRGESVDHRSDVFAFGAIVIELITGKPAFTGASSAEVVSAILRDESSQLGALPPALARIVRRCMEKRAERRFQSTRDLLFALESLRTDDLVRAPRRVPRFVVPLLGIAVVAALVAMAWRWMPRSSNSSPKIGLPTIERLTYRRGSISNARFEADGKTVLYSARWEADPSFLATTRAGIFESRPIDIGEAQLLAVSQNGDLAVLVHPTRWSVWGFFTVGTLAKTSLGGGTPRESIENVAYADFAPDGALLVVRVIDNQWTLESPPGHVLYSTRGWISQPRFSHDGSEIAFIDHPAPEDDAGRVTLIDRAGHRAGLGQQYLSVQGLVWSPSGRELWFTAATHGATRSLRALDRAGHERVLYSAPGSLRLFDVSPSGDVLIERVEPRAQAIVERNGVARDVSWLDGTAIADCGATSFLFTESWDGAGDEFHSFTRSYDGGPAIHIADGAGSSISADGKRVLYNRHMPDGTFEAWMSPVGAGEPVLIDRGEILTEHFMPDDKTIMLGGPDGSIDIFDPQTKQRRRALSAVATVPYQYKISPDGRYLYSRDRRGQFSRFDFANGAVTPLGTGHLSPIAFSKDMAHVLVVVNDQHIPTAISDIEIATNTMRTLRTLAPPDLAGVHGLVGYCSPDDGTTLAYSYFQQLDTLYSMTGIE